MGGGDLRPMQAEELEKYFHAPAGYLGPVGLTAAKALHDGGVNVILDPGLENRQNLVAGANKLDYHYRNVTPGRDFTWTIAADIRNVAEGEACPECGGALKVAKAVEIGHIFKLGYKYSESMGARVLDPNGKEVTPIMGSYGIGIERILTAAVEQSTDANGFWLSPAIAPFDVVVTITNVADQSLLTAGTQIAESLEAAGFDVLLDDREERARREIQGRRPDRRPLPHQRGKESCRRQSGTRNSAAHPRAKIPLSQKLPPPFGKNSTARNTGPTAYCLSLLMGTTCTVVTRISARKRLMIDPRSRISKRDRADCPKTTCEMFSFCAN